MKKTASFILCFFFFSTFLFAQDEEIAWNNGDNKDFYITPDKDVVWVYDTPEEDVIVVEKKGPLRVPDRIFEIGINLRFGISNDFMTTSEIFREKVNIDLDKLSDGFNINANLFLTPFYLSINKNNIWGLGVSSGLDLLGVIGLNGSMLTFHEANEAESDLGAAVFADVNINGFFIYEKFKIKVKPAVYYPLLYARPDSFSYTFKNKKTNGIDETYFNTKFDMRVYTAYPVEDDFDLFKIFGNIDKFTARPGIDISLGAEYPLSETLGLIDKYDFLDFDVGVDFINVPLYPSDMEDYVRMMVNIGSDKPIDFFSGMLKEDSEEIDIDSYYDYQYEDYGKARRNVFRPFKMLISANWHPFDRPFLKEDNDLSFKYKREWLTFIPILGFAVNPLYFQPVSFEGGIKTRLNLLNFFIVTLDIGYYDRLWKNGLDFALNFKLFEVDFGVNMQSSGFLKSWSRGGFGAFLGLKFGW